MSWLGEIILQAGRDVWSHKLRAALTMFGIAWGIAAIIFMMAIGDGFKLGYRNTLYALGKDVVIVWGGRTAGQAGGQRAGRDVRLTYSDVTAIQDECTHIHQVTPEMSRTLTATSRFNSGSFSGHGVTPVYQEIRSMLLGGGRLLNLPDIDTARTVCLLGDAVRKQLFADRSAIGATLLIEGIPCTVVGELRPKDQNNSYNGLDDNKIILPYSTMVRYFPQPEPYVGEPRLNNLVFTPVTAGLHDEAIRQVRTVLGRRHHFDPDDEGALYVWDTVETARMVNGVYESMQWFLVFVAVITLGLGGLGVMNVMLVAVTERTREIGVKQAVGATPGRILTEFFLESMVLTLASGVLGLLVAWLATGLVNRLPMPAMFAGLPVRPGTAILATGTLVIVGVLAAIYPAHRASRLTPVEALRYE